MRSKFATACALWVFRILIVVTIGKPGFLASVPPLLDRTFSTQAFRARNEPSQDGDRFGIEPRLKLQLNRAMAPAALG